MKVTNKIKKKINKILKFISMICLCFSLCVPLTSAYAAPPAANSGNTLTVPEGGADAGPIKDLANIFVSLFEGISILLLIYGIGTLIVASKNDNPEERQKAIVIIVVAAVFFGIKTIAVSVINIAFENAGYGSFDF
jgi:hypothetical protein